jgi:hypothetical protein
MEVVSDSGSLTIYPILFNICSGNRWFGPCRQERAAMSVLRRGLRERIEAESVLDGGADPIAKCGPIRS